MSGPLRQIPPSIWALGFVSLLMDTSSELIHSLLPAFLVGTLGASAAMLGFIEGAAESLALIIKIFSGVLSDYLGRRKALALAGYGLAALSKPLFALAAGPGWVLGARLVDRVGKGLRGAPRDALVADIAPPHVRGAAFGLRQALDTVGAFIGPLLAIGLMLLLADHYRSVFWFAVIPAVLSVMLLFGVREPEHPREGKPANPLALASLKRLHAHYWWVVAFGALFMLARFSEAFLVLRARQGGLGDAWLPLVFVAMNVVYALTAYPFGKLADTMRHTTLLKYGLLLLISSDIVLGISSHLTVVFAGIVLWGLHMGLTQGLLATMVAGAAPADLRGTAFGFFYLCSGAAMLGASVVAGELWEHLGAAYTFHGGAAFAVVALLIITLNDKSAPKTGEVGR
jgi:MFS family permease